MRSRRRPEWWQITLIHIAIGLVMLSVRCAAGHYSGCVALAVRYTRGIDVYIDASVCIRREYIDGSCEGGNEVSSPVTEARPSLLLGGLQG